MMKKEMVDQASAKMILFFCQQKHFPKKVGKGGNTICTSEDMLVVLTKNDLGYYKLRNQTCCVKNDNCIFETGNYSHFEIWSQVPLCGNIYYCNRCARYGRHKEVDQSVTSMCVNCFVSCQQISQNSTSSKGDHCVGKKRPKRTVTRTSQYKP